MSPTKIRNFIFLVLMLQSSIQAFSQKIFDVDGEVRNNSIVVTNTALDMIQKGNHASAARILEKVVEDDPTFHPAYLNFYRAGSQVPAYKEKVVQVLRAGLEIFEEDDELAYYLGNFFQKEKRLNEAVAAYSDAIRWSKINGEDFPLVWAYYFNRGNSYLKLLQFDKAIGDYKEALRLSPDHPDVLVNRGYCFYKTNQNAQACKDWSLAVQKGSKDAQRYLDLYCQ